jgi:hypothetical protein
VYVQRNWLIGFENRLSTALNSVATFPSRGCFIKKKKKKKKKKKQHDSKVAQNIATNFVSNFTA